MLAKPNAPILRYSDTPLRLSGRRPFVWIIGSLVALAWLTLSIWHWSPYGRYLDHERLGEIGIVGGRDSLLVPVTLYLVGWLLMTVAMMLPTTVPLLETFRRLTTRRPDQ